MDKTLFSSTAAKQLKKCLAEGFRKYPDIWQFELLPGKKLCELARERDLSYWCLNDDIDKFWIVGLLSADVIESDVEQKLAGLKAKKYGDLVEYVDNRNPEPDPSGLQGAFARLDPLPDALRLMYHPFRLYVRTRLERVFELSMSYSHFFYEKKYGKVGIQAFLDYKRKVTSTSEIYELFDRINLIASLAISCEPIAAGKVLGSYRYSTRNPDGSERSVNEYHAERQSYKENQLKVIQKIGLDPIKEIISLLCRQAQDIDPNLDIHRVIRFAKKDFRLKTVKGKLGISIYLLTMAEVIRRTTEEVFEIKLPEEDENGYYRSEPAGKERRWGASRLLDDEDAQKLFLRTYGLDREIRLRWYVEGETEFALLEAVLGNEPFIELINLRGQVVARGGKGLAFKQNLANDIKTSVYSWVSIDGDIDPYVRVLRTAAKNKEMFGMFFISTPDFEFHNFSSSELIEIVIDLMDDEGGVSEEQESDLMAKCKNTKSNKEFFKAVKEVFPHYIRIGKGDLWGKKLAEFAGRNPIKECADGSKSERDIVRAIRSALQSLDTNYRLGWLEGRVDPDTGRIEYKK